MILKKLTEGLKFLKTEGSAEVEITSLGLNSQTAEHGQLFFALRGEKADGHRYINDAIARGAVAIV
jgi:UDP-N-acetylmuramoyl-L-alanyl-D-glutamate--2,6-diaminopimelate ligase